MKTIILIRHAKSSWDDHTVSDFDRPLNERGKHDAPMMAERLLKKQPDIQAFITSPAKRARKTAAVFAKAYGLDKDDIQLKDELYLAPENVFYEVISQVPESVNSIAVFAHNPGITDFVNSLTDVKIDNVPTCGLFAISYNGNWQSFETAPKQFLFFDYPKNEA
ncbi:MAG TPA: histidine phosphatase family protein [Chitinophagaceae bacterium]|nr:histidine phosphatase family protein [Chitinophagaceae bacterium]